MSSTQEKIEEILRSVQSMGYNQAISDSSDAHTESGAIYVDEALPQIETLINQARKEAVIEELESIPVVASFDRVYMHILGRLEALKEGK